LRCAISSREVSGPGLQSASNWCRIGAFFFPNSQFQMRLVESNYQNSNSKLQLPKIHELPPVPPVEPNMHFLYRGERMVRTPKNPSEPMQCANRRDKNDCKQNSLRLILRTSETTHNRPHQSRQDQIEPRAPHSLPTRPPEIPKCEVIVAPILDSKGVWVTHLIAVPDAENAVNRLSSTSSFNFR
jgi:hypothetical protein